MKLFCFMGPSGSGKSVIQHSIPKLRFLTHYVTRELRKDEIDGYHVKHISREEFEQEFAAGNIVTRTEYAGNLYGAPNSFLSDILDREISYHATATKESIEQFKKLLGDDRVVTIYIKPPSRNALVERMTARGDSKENIEQRIANMLSTAELENESFADYVIVNDELNTAKLVALGIIYHETSAKGKLEL